MLKTVLSNLVANMHIPALHPRLQDTFLGILIFQVEYHSRLQRLQRHG